MNKKLEIDLDIPVDDLDCWYRYPKHRWVYETTRLLDSQQIRWNLIKTQDYPYQVKNFTLESLIPVDIDRGTIFLQQDIANSQCYEVFINKGDIKLIKNSDDTSKDGQCVLRITAFVSLHFAKFTGVVRFWICHGNIVRTSLMPKCDRDLDYDSLRLLRKIYKKTDVTINGLSDQALNDSFAS